MKKLIPLLLAGLAAVGLNAQTTSTSITGLPAISSVTSSTVVPVVDVAGSPTTKKATVAQLVSGLPAATGSTIGLMLAADKAKLDAAATAATAATLVLRDASGNFSGSVITAAQVTGLASPTLGSDAANKTYVDAAAAGLVIKTPAVAGTSGGNITLSGGAPNTLDGITLHANDRVLVKDQTTNTQNGIYFVQTLGSGSNGTWARTTDADTGAELVTGSYVFIAGGTVNANAAYTMTTTGTITIGTSPIVWNLFSQVTQIQASNIIGQIVAAQIQDAAINTAKFAAGLTPVEILGALPGSGNFAGRQVFLTTDSKLYRYNGSSFVNTLAAADITGTIGTTQIADNSISTPKLQANSVTASILAANSVVAGDITAGAVTAGTIAAGAVNTSELAAGAVVASKIAAGTITANELAANSVTAAKILAGTITADKLTISSLSAITANIGTVTSGSISGTTITAGTGTAAVSISGSGLTAASGRVSLAGDGTNPWVRVYGTGTYASGFVEFNGQNGSVPPILQFQTGTGTSATLGGFGVISVTNGSNQAQLAASGAITGDQLLNNGGNGNYTIPMKVFSDNNFISFEYAGSNTLRVKIDSTVFTVALTP